MAAAVAAPAVVVAMRGERRVPLRGLGETFPGVFFEVPRLRRLFPSFLGVLRMLKAIDWRRSACGEGRSVSLLLRGSASKASLGLPSPPSVLN